MYPCFTVSSDTVPKRKKEKKKKKPKALDPTAPLKILIPNQRTTQQST
jgi:hypothetical protein